MIKLIFSNNQWQCELEERSMRGFVYARSPKGTFIESQDLFTHFNRNNPLPTKGHTVACVLLQGKITCTNSKLLVRASYNQSRISMCAEPGKKTCTNSKLLVRVSYQSRISRINITCTNSKLLDRALYHLSQISLCIAPGKK